MVATRLVSAALESISVEAEAKGKTLLAVMQKRAASGYDGAASFVTSHTSGGRRTDFSTGTGSNGLSRSEAAEVIVYLIELHERALAALGLQSAVVQKNSDIKA